LRLKDLVEYAAQLDNFEPPQMTSFLGVPIVSRGQTVGVLYLGNKIGMDEFCESDQQAVEMLAAYAAVAVQNAKLYQKVQQLAVLEERERIGMDLHDGIIQSIFAVGLTLEHGAMLMDEAPQEARGRIQNAIDGLNQIIRDIRNYILDLRPQRMRPHDLIGSLHRIVEEFRANTLVDISLDMSPGVTNDLGEATSTALFLIAQEALANAAKHANATTLSLKIRRVEDLYVTLEVKDNGTGFNALGTEPIIGHGLSNMQLRANAVGGRLQIRSKPGQGTTIKVALPLSSS
jgi:signal transduction histidine kinase